MENKTLNLKSTMSNYKEPMKYPQYPLFYQMNDKDVMDKFNEDLKKYEMIKKHRCINRCECGVEWEHEYEEYQDGCYPYIKAECDGCRLKREMRKIELLKTNKINSRLIDFENRLPGEYKAKALTVSKKSLLSSNRSIIFGAYGTGKNHECYAVIKKLLGLQEIQEWQMITELDLINLLKANNFEHFETYNRAFRDIEMLVLDEMGKSGSSKFDLSHVESILNSRYNHKKRTILICNAISPNELSNYITTAVLDRFRENIVCIDGKSRRYQ